MWEIKSLRPRLHGRWVFVCEESQFKRADRDDNGVDVHRRLDETLEGQEVLLYSTASKRHVRRFSKALRMQLEAAAR